MNPTPTEREEKFREDMEYVDKLNALTEKLIGITAKILNK